MHTHITVCLAAVCVAMMLFVMETPLHNSDIQSLEDEVIFKLYGDNVKSAWKNIQVTTLNGSTESWLTHYIEPGHFLESKPDVLLLHGYGATSAFTWRATIPALVQKFNVYAIDMPGFGRTEAPASLLVCSLIRYFEHDFYS